MEEKDSASKISFKVSLMQMKTNDVRCSTDTKNIIFENKHRLSINKTMREGKSNDLNVELPKFLQTRKSTGIVSRTNK